MTYCYLCLHVFRHVPSIINFEDIWPLRNCIAFFHQICSGASLGRGEQYLWISWSLLFWNPRDGIETFKSSTVFKNFLYPLASGIKTGCFVIPVLSIKTSTKNCGSDGECLKNPLYSWKCLGKKSRCIVQGLKLTFYISSPAGLIGFIFNKAAEKFTCPPGFSRNNKIHFVIQIK